ncbi:response regulator [Zunongwangia sp. F363]|uniref:histidine kinase n=1 Tax=Autumnicola tepida TaxID=3075595 RepID=A0ABU3C9G1_9FLAO|nr:response regulator [Zunongwangia sp. F363]MDT0642969.1 response regulator [Zunongwangia sp. F363]
MKKSYLLFLLLFITFIPVGGLAQKDPCFDAQLDSLYNISSNSIEKYDYKEAIIQARNLIEEARLRDNNSYIFHAYNMLGASYSDLKDTIRARENYEEALEYAVKSRNDTLVLWANNNLGNIYSEDKKTKQTGIDYYNKAIALAKKLNSKIEVLYPTVNIAWTYLDNDAPSRAKPYLEEAWEIVEEIHKDDKYLLSQLNYLTGRYHAEVNELEKAEKFLKEAIANAEDENYLIEASLAYKEYAKVLFSLEKYEDAYLALDKYEEYNSEVFEQERLRQVEIANAQFDNNEFQNNLKLAEKEQEYQAQIIKKSNEKIFIMLVSSIILVIILFSLNKINRDRTKLIQELKHKNKELRDSKDEAERLARLKTQFFSTVSHEIRTPLYGVIGLTSLLLEDESLKKHESDLKSLKFSADYLLALINDVLQMNKMESKQLRLEKVSFHLQDLMTSVLNTFEFSRVQNNNKIHVDVDKDIPSYLMGDPVRLSQIMMNLVGNAVKFTERGNIYISARLRKVVDENYIIYFEVKDDGIGIPENKQKTIFEEFSQVSTTNYSYQGTGLGLPIVKKLLELHDSEIKLKSEEGKGSTFSFVIPFEKDKDRRETARNEEVKSSFKEYEDSLHPKKILIVDDNHINQVVTTKILKKENFECDVAGSGEEAIEKLQETNFDLVLMDLNMPGMGGLEATKKIRESNTKVPVVALTAVEVDEMREKIYNAGMDDIIVKPYDVQQFYQIIYRNMSGRKIPCEL